MPEPTKSLLSYLRVMLVAWRDDPRDDAHLLARFAEARDEEAFTGLVGRHGPLVWQTCRRILGDTPDAEDAFQTTFLTLARKAGHVTIKNIAGWLHQVARRFALEIQSDVRRSQRLEQQLRAKTRPSGEEDSARAELHRALDEELAGLPERIRVPLLLHYLEGRSQVEVARILSCARSVLQKRLIQGEAILRQRLERRGLKVVIGSMTATELLGGSTAAPAVPACLIDKTVRAVSRSLSCPIPESSTIVALAKKVLKTTLITKVKIAAVGLGVTMSLAGGGLLAYQALVGNAAKLSQPAGEVRGGAEPSRQTETGARVDRYGDPLPKGALARLGTMRLRHPGWVCSITFSPDGKTIASGGKYRDVCLWEVASGKEIRSLEKLSGEPLVVAFSPDGKTVVSGGRNEGAVRLWDAASGKLIRTLTEDQGRKVSAVVFSPDSKIVASAQGLDDGEVRLWEAASGKEIRTLQGEKGWVLSVAFSADGKIVASGGDRRLRLWEAASGKEINILKGHQGMVRMAAFSPDGKIVASVGDDGTVRLWKMASDKEFHILKGHQGEVFAVAFAPDGKTVASGGYDGTVRLWDVATGKEIRTLKTIKGWDWSVAFSPDGKVVAAGGWNGRVHLWETTTGEPICRSEGHEGWVQSVAFSPGSKIVASGGRDNTVRLWEAATGKPVRTLDGHGGSVWLVALSSDGRIVASGGNGEGGPVHLWETATGKLIRAFRGDKGRFLSAVALSSDGQTVASGWADGTVRLWKAATGEEIRILKGSEKSVFSMVFSPDGQTVASGGDDETVRLWDVATGKEIRTLRGHNRRVNSVAFSPDGRIVASGGYDGRVRLWEVASGKEIHNLLGNDEVTGLAFSPEGKILAIGFGNCIQLWDLFSGAALPPLVGHRSRVNGMTFSADGRVLVSVSGDTTGLVWGLNYGAARPATKLTPDVLSVLWTDLASMDAGQAWQAIWKLTATPSQSVTLLRDRLRPMPAEAKKRLARLVLDLDADDFRVRECAQQEIEKLGPDTEPVLRKALEGKLSSEMRRRLEQLLEPAGGPNRRGLYSGKFLRGLRAVAVLEQVGTPEARQVLKRMAASVPGLYLTQEAQAVLKRLKGISRP